MRLGGHDVVWPADGSGAPDLSRLGGCSLVHFNRRCDKGTHRVLADLARRGTAITWDTDDDLTAIPKESPVYEKTAGLAARRIFSETVKVARLARCMTTTNEVLAEKYRRAGIDQVDVISNYLPGGVVRRPRRHDGVWSAGLRAWSTRLTPPGSRWRRPYGG